MIDKERQYINNRWKMLLSFCFLYLLIYNGRQNINLLLTQMSNYFNTDTTTIGIISSSLFWCYAFGQLINGRLGEYIGHKKTIAIGTTMSIVMNVLISYQNSITIIAILWGLNGFFQSMIWSNGIGVINKWWKEDKRSLATGIATASSGLAQVVTYLSIAFCLTYFPDLGWRAGFRYPVLLIFIATIPFTAFFHDNPDFNYNYKADKESKNKKDYFLPYKELFKEKKVVLFCFISAIAGIGRYGLLTWIPTYFVETLNLSIKNSIFSSILLPIGQAFAMFVFPVMTDKLFKGKRESMLLLASIMTFICLVLFAFIDNKNIASLLLFLVGVFSMVTGIIWTIAGDIGGKEYSSTLVGILDWSVYMGAAIQTYLFGFMKNTFGWSAIFITIGILYIFMFILTILASKIEVKIKK